MGRRSAEAILSDAPGHESFEDMIALILKLRISLALEQRCHAQTAELSTMRDAAVPIIVAVQASNVDSVRHASTISCRRMGRRTLMLSMNLSALCQITFSGYKFSSAEVLELNIRCMYMKGCNPHHEEALPYISRFNATQNRRPWQVYSPRKRPFGECR